MWTAGRAKPAPHRSASVHSVASRSASRPVSVHSPQIQRQPDNYDSDSFSETGSDDEQSFPGGRFNSTAPLAWSRPQAGSPANMIAQKMETQVAPPATNIQYHSQPKFQQRPVDDDATSRSSTLDGQEDNDLYSSKQSVSHSATKTSLTRQEPVPRAPAPHVPGPLESQLAALMSKLIHIEQSNPAVSITPEDYEQMKSRLEKLEEEKKVWWKRHEAIWSLRDEDVENNIKIRGMLASARRELEATKALRDEDLLNVQIVRSKLAEKTREVERLHAQGQAGRSSPNRPRMSSFLERRDTTDLFTAAKIAALEQRALELEKRNSDLVEQLAMSRGGGNIDDLNRSTAHQAWKSTVADLEAKVREKDAEIARIRPGGASGAASAGIQMDWYRIEALFEEHASYREGVGGRMQALRSEKEGLMKDLHRKENDCQALELKVQMLQRRANVL